MLALPSHPGLAHARLRLSHSGEYDRHVQRKQIAAPNTLAVTRGQTSPPVNNRRCGLADAVSALNPGDESLTAVPRRLTVLRDGCAANQCKQPLVMRRQRYNVNASSVVIDAATCEVQHGRVRSPKLEVPAVHGLQRPRNSHAPPPHHR